MACSNLDIQNVLSTLISADNMKRDSFVEECIRYVCSHLEELLCAHANFTPLNETLIKKIAFTFNHNELDNLRDKKDKIKSILFYKRIDSLLNDEKNSIFRCRVCGLLLTTKWQMKLRCHPTQMAIDRYGELVSLHIKDPNFDEDNFVKQLLTDVGTSRRVYWCLWGIFNCLQCSSCKEYFRCCDLHKCRHHPEDAKFARIFLDQSPPNSRPHEVYYKCCKLTTIRFDPLEINMGCLLKDHIVDTSKDEFNEIYADLLAHQNQICITVNPQSDKPEQRKLKRQTSCGILSFDTSQTVDKSSSCHVDNDSHNNSSSSEETDSSEASEVEGTPPSRLARKIARWKWTSRHGLRYNQDMQREHEQMKLDNLKQRYLPAGNKKDESQQAAEGGIYARLETEWKEKYFSPKVTKAAPLTTRTYKSWVSKSLDKLPNQKFLPGRFKLQLAAQNEKLTSKGNEL